LTPSDPNATITIAFGSGFPMANVALISVLDKLCFGLRYIAANLKRSGHHPTIIAFKVANEFDNPVEDEIIHPEFRTGLHANEKEIALLIDLLRALRTDVVGMTITSTCRDISALLAGRLKDDGGYPIVWGGADVFFNPNDALEHADVICMGDGEEAMVEIVDALTGGKSLENIKGIWFRSGNGSIAKTEPRPRIQDLDSIPIPLWDLSDTYYVSENRIWHQEYHPFGIMQPEVRFLVTARGCPFRCTYCCNNSTGRQVHYGDRIFRRSVDNVIEEGRRIQEQVKSVHHLYIMDEIFNVGGEWLNEFSERWPKEVGLPFIIMNHPNAIKAHAMKMLRGAGLCKITMGVQTGSERINRDVVGRAATREKILEAGRIMAENDIFYVVDLIHENPYEEEEDYRETARTLNEFARPYMLGPVNPLQLWTNYDITKMALRDGMDLEQDNSHTYVSRKKPEYDFWHALYLLVSICPMDGQAVEFLMDARMRPGGGELVRKLGGRIFSATYYSRHPLHRIPKDEIIEDLEGRLARFGGSRMVRAYFGLKERFLRLVGVKSRAPFQQEAAERTYPLKALTRDPHPQ
jgi:anaerobic magnesium-protoporphyrin IX monomethyl ester cyclase